MEQFFQNIFSQQTGITTQGAILLSAISLWSLFWKGIALYHAAQRKQLVWFCGILVLNTAGILEIIYLFIVTKTKIDLKAVRKRIKS